MIALVLLGFFAIYFWVSFLIVKGTAGWAKKRGRSRWGWGFLSAFLMYNLVFWDWIPSVVLQSYYCKTEAGFWVYKTPEQWVAENPEAIKMLTYKYASDSMVTEHGYTNHVNQRMDRTYQQTNLWPNIKRYEHTLIDVQSKIVLVRQIYFKCGPCTGMRINSLWELRSIQRCECEAVTKKGNNGFYAVNVRYNKLGKQNDN